MDVGTVLSIVSIVISLVLSIGGVFLSLWFYKESNTQNKETALMQVEIKDSVGKLEKLYDRTYTDTFGVLRGQMDAMQKHIFSTTVGTTNDSEPDNLKMYVLGCISQKNIMTIDDLCSQIKGFDKHLITDTIYGFHREGLISFDGKIITFKKTLNQSEIESEPVGVIS